MGMSKKKLLQTVESFEKELKLHEGKLKEAKRKGDDNLAAYYVKEIAAKKKEHDKYKSLVDSGSGFEATCPKHGTVQARNNKCPKPGCGAYLA